MSPAEASFALATIVGLLCNWKQERSSVSTDRFQDFITWLTAHNFNELRSYILESADVQRELQLLLREDAAEISRKLDLLSSSLSAISDRIEGFAPLTRALHKPTEALSSDAAQILKIVEQTGARGFVLLRNRSPRGILLLPLNRFIEVADPRFLDDDIASLASFGLMSLTDHNGSGDPIFSLTRVGSRFAAELPPVEIGPVKRP